MTVLLSIKPQFVEKILSGDKQFEYRKKIFCEDVDKVVIYSSSPEKMLIGVFYVNEVLKDSPKGLWEKTQQVSGINKDFFDLYYKDRDIAYGIKIDKLIKLDKPLPLSAIGIKRPPQSFQYLENQIVDKLI